MDVYTSWGGLVADVTRYAPLSDDAPRIWVEMTIERRCASQGVKTDARGFCTPHFLDSLRQGGVESLTTRHPGLQEAIQAEVERRVSAHFSGDPWSWITWEWWG